MKDNWKFWVGITVCVLVTALAGWRLRYAFSDQPPAWLQQEKRTSETIPKPVREAFARFLRQIQQTADRTQRHIGSIEFLELPRDEKKAVRWSSDLLVNQGFDPLENFERPAPNDASQLLGYYALDGTPLPFTIRRDPRNKRVGAAVKLSPPLAAGASQLIFCREIRAASLNPQKDDSLRLGLGRLRKTSPDITAQGLWFPDYKLARYAPEKGAVDLTSDIPLVGWINEALETETAYPVVNLRRR